MVSLSTNDDTLAIADATQSISRLPNNPSDKRPCRMAIFTEGLEVFLYNRTPAFDAIISRMQNSEGPGSAVGDDSDSNLSGRTGLKQTNTTEEVEELLDLDQTTTKWRRPWKWRRQKDEKDQNRTDIKTDAVRQASGRPLEPSVPQAAKRTNSKEDGAPVWQWERDICPIEIEMHTAAIVVGSDATPTVTIAEFKTARGSYETAEVSGLWLWNVFLNCY